MRKMDFKSSSKVNKFKSKKELIDKTLISLVPEEKHSEAGNANELTSLNEALKNISKSNRNSWKLNKIKGRIKGRILNYKKTNNLDSNLDIYYYMSSDDSLSSGEISIEEIFPYKFICAKELEAKPKNDTPCRLSSSNKNYLRKFLSRKSKKDKRIINNAIEKTANQNQTNDVPLGNLVFQYMKSRGTSERGGSINDIDKYMKDRKRQLEKNQFYSLHSSRQLKKIDLHKNLLCKKEIVDVEEIKTTGKVDWSTFANKILIKNSGKVGINEIELRMIKTLSSGVKSTAIKESANNQDILTQERQRMVVKEISLVTNIQNKDLLIKVPKKDIKKSAPIQEEEKVSTDAGFLSQILAKSSKCKDKSHSLMQKRVLLSIGNGKTFSTITASKGNYFKHKASVSTLPTHNSLIDLGNLSSTIKTPRLSIDLNQKPQGESLKISSFISSMTNKSSNFNANNKLNNDTKQTDSSIQQMNSPCRSTLKLKTAANQKSPLHSKHDIEKMPESTRKTARGNSYVIDFNVLKQNIVKKQNKYLKFLKNFKNIISESTQDYDFKLVNNIIEASTPQIIYLKDEQLKNSLDPSFLKVLNLSDSDYNNLQNLKFGIRSYEAELKKYPSILTKEGKLIPLIKALKRIF